MNKIDISTEEKKQNLYNLFCSFNKKQDIYNFLKISNNSFGKKYIDEIAKEIKFDFDVYKQKKKRYCLLCGKELNSHQKKFCSSSCSAKFFNLGKKLKEETKKKISESLKKRYKQEDRHKEPKFCEVCGKEIHYPNKKYCSAECRKTTYKKEKNVVKKCEYCGREFIGNSTRKFCSQECANSKETDERIKYWKEGLWVINPNGRFPNSIRQYLLDRSKYKCENCGFEGYNKKTGKTILQIHHIDGNSSNNKEDNLTVLCPNCHAMTDTYMALNKGKSARTKRYKNGE